VGRTQKSFKNIKFALFGQAINIVLSFATRKVFISILETEYLGLSGVFSNILSLLSLAELGVGSALIYCLYKPIVEDDREKIKTIMVIYKKTYSAIGILVSFLGIILTPFLDSFVKEMPNLPNIQLIYILYVLNSGISYFLVYKRSFIIANQNGYICTIYSTISKFAMYVIQILVLLFTQEYILFLLTMITFTIGENLLISLKADKMYPFLSEKATYKLPADEKLALKKNIIGMSFHKFGDILVNGITNLLIGKIVGVFEVGLYSNYLLIRNSLDMVTNLIYQSITPSIGNLNIEAEDKYKLTVFNRLFFLTAWVFGFCATGLICLYNPFITVWLGNKYLFGMHTIIVIVLNFYLIGMRKPIAATRDAMGLFWYDRLKCIPEIIINLVVSLFLGKRYGIVGIFYGNLVSNLSTTFWIYPLVLYKYGLHTDIRKYFIRLIIYICATVAGVFLTFGACSFIRGVSIVSFIIKFIICAVLPNILYIALSFKTPEFTYFFNLILRNSIVKKVKLN